MVLRSVPPSSTPRSAKLSPSQAYSASPSHLDRELLPRRCAELDLQRTGRGEVVALPRELADALLVGGLERNALRLVGVGVSDEREEGGDCGGGESEGLHRLVPQHTCPVGVEPRDQHTLVDAAAPLLLVLCFGV